MAISCEPADLVEAAKCYQCISADAVTRDSVIIYLLANIAGLSASTPAELAAAAKCYQCLPDDTQKAIRNYLLCTIANL